MIARPAWLISELEVVLIILKKVLFFKTIVDEIIILMIFLIMGRYNMLIITTIYFNMTPIQIHIIRSEWIIQIIDKISKRDHKNLHGSESLRD